MKLKSFYYFCAIVVLFSFNSLVVLSQIINPVISGFSCQGDTFDSALQNCLTPSGYVVQPASAGGNVTVLVQYATNLKNSDFSGPIGGVSDPYVKFTINQAISNSGNGRSSSYSTIASIFSSNIVSKRSKIIHNNLNPQWNQEISLGVLQSGTKIRVEIFDKDSGIEFSDDLLYRSHIRIPFCSMFNSSTSTKICKNPFDCESDDSAWAMPERKRCQESGTINFNTKYSCNHDKSVCLHLTFYIVPMQIKVEKSVASQTLTTSPTITAVGTAYPTRFSWTSSFGKPYQVGSESTAVIDGSSSKILEGGLMIQTRNDDRMYGQKNQISHYLSVNFPSTVYICRENESGRLPDWLKSYSSVFSTARQLTVSGSSLRKLPCYLKDYEATIKNQWGGVISNIIPLYTNVVEGQTQYTYNYITVVIPRVEGINDDSNKIIYDSGGFVKMLFTYGLGFAFFLFITVNFLEKIEYRVDRISAYVITRVNTGTERSLLSAILLNKDKSPCNIEYRAHVYHASNSIKFILFIPFALLFSFGISCSILISPSALGISIAFIGVSLLFLFFGMRLWKLSQWRLSGLTVASLFFFVFFFFLFMIIVLFYDSDNIIGKDINFTALSLVFATLNCIPNLILIFKNDRSHKVYMELVMTKIAEAIFHVKKSTTNVDVSSLVGTNGSMKLNRLLHALLGDTYSINPSIPSLRFSTVIMELNSSFQSNAEKLKTKETGSLEEQELLSKTNRHLESERNIYYVSLFVLFIYLLFAIGRTSYPSLAFLHICALILLDFIHLSISKSECNWSTGFKVFMLVFGRLFICGSYEEYWVIGYAVCYLLYSITLIYELINIWLPILSEVKAAEIVFGGSLESYNSVRNSLKTKDITGSPSFSLFALFFSFLSVLIIAASLPKSYNESDSNSQLLMPNMEVLGMEGWPIYLFGLIAFLISIISGFIIASFRLSKMQSHDLLQGWSREAFLINPFFKLPLVMTLTTELSILFSGLLLYALTRAVAVLISSIFIPIIILLFGISFHYWLKNDFDLVKWPRQLIDPEKELEKRKVLEGVLVGGKIESQHSNFDTFSKVNQVLSPLKTSDLSQNAFTPTSNINLMNQAFGDTKASISDVNYTFVEDINDENANNNQPETNFYGAMGQIDERSNFKGFSLPSFGNTGFELSSNLGDINGGGNSDIKMPSLPLKSVLRRKRQAMGIKGSNNPLVKDLKARETSVDKDQFGDKGDVLDINDPWAEFELSEAQEQQLLQKKKKKEKTKLKSTVVVTKNNENFLIKIRKFVRNNSALRSFFNAFSYFYNKISPSKVHPESKYEIENNDEDELFDPEAGELDDELQMRAKAKATELAIKRRMEAEEARKRRDMLDLNFIDVNKLAFWEAFWLGVLNRDEYTPVLSFFGGVLFLMLYGIVMSATVNPPYLGYLIWFISWLIIFTGIPIVRYFTKYNYDDTCSLSVKFVVFIHILFCVLMFIIENNKDIQNVRSLWLANYFIYYPLVVYIIFEISKWIDSGFTCAFFGFYNGNIVGLTGENYGSQTHKVSLTGFQKFKVFLRSFPMIILYVAIFNIELYLWFGRITGVIFTLILLASIFILVYLQNWANNDYFLSPEYIIFGRFSLNILILVSGLVALFDTYNPILSISICMFGLIIKFGLIALGYYIDMAKGSILFFSPYFFPVYSLHSGVQDVESQSDFVLNILSSIFFFFLWGVLLTVFHFPINVGIGLLCTIFLIAITGIALAISYVPRQLARFNSLLKVDSILDAAKRAKSKFYERKLPLNIEMSNYNGNETSETENPMQEEKVKSQLDFLKERTCIENSIALLNDIRALKYVKDDLESDETDDVTASNTPKKSEDNEVDDEDDDDEAIEESVSFVTNIVNNIKDITRQMYELLPVNKELGWRRHNQGLFNSTDAFVEIVMRGRGPYGAIGLEGWPLQQCIDCRHSSYFSFLYPKWTENYDTVGNNFNHAELSEPLDYNFAFERILNLDKAIDFTCFEESRTAIYFLLMILVSADSTMRRDQVLFQRFLRENRSRLLSNGIQVPSYIFTTESYSSINIPLVAIWLKTLPQDDQDRFHMLKNQFNQDQKARDDHIDQLNYEDQLHAIEIENSRLKRDFDIRQKMSIEIAKQKEERVQRFIDSLEGFEKTRFLAKRDLWVSDPDCFVDIRDNDLFQKFKQACLKETSDELNEYARQYLIDCETAQKDIRLGEYGRQYQFVDSDFQPNEVSIGNTDSRRVILGWRCAPGIVSPSAVSNSSVTSASCDIFEGGTNVENIFQGVFKDNWLISAVSMLVSSSSNKGKGYINEKIFSLFIPHPSASTIGLGEAQEDITLETEVGAYGIKIHRNGEWIPVIVDDLLPLRLKEFWTDANKGLACSYTYQSKGLWLSLLEKAFAKYYGSYASIENGYVHHALRDLTGCDSECIYLNSYARSMNKFALWDQLLQFHKNGYILGAQTPSNDLIDREILEMGILFDTSYSILDVRQVDGHRILKLRAPSGNSTTWKGDWSWDSKLWTQRLRYKLIGKPVFTITASNSSSTSVASNENSVESNSSVTPIEDDPSIFFMSFEDFLNIFRCLFVCKYYNPEKWSETTLFGIWKRADESAVEQMDMMSQFFLEQQKNEADIESGMAESEANPNNEADQGDGKNQDNLLLKKAKARLDTSGGLPSKNNPACVLENNPHYHLKVYRPTDLKITITQLNTMTSTSLGMMAKHLKKKDYHPACILLVSKSGDLESSSELRDAPKNTGLKRLTSLTKEDVLYSSGEPVAEKTIHLYINNLAAGEYTILVGTYLAGMEGEFNITVMSNYRADLSPIWPPAWMFKEENKALGANVNDTRRLVNNHTKKNVKKMTNFLSRGLKSLLGVDDEYDNEDEEDDDDDEVKKKQDLEDFGFPDEKP